MHSVKYLVEIKILSTANLNHQFSFSPSAPISSRCPPPCILVLWFPPVKVGGKLKPYLPPNYHCRAIYHFINPSPLLRENLSASLPSSCCTHYQRKCCIVTMQINYLTRARDSNSATSSRVIQPRSPPTQAQSSQPMLQNPRNKPIRSSRRCIHNDVRYARRLSDLRPRLRLAGTPSKAKAAARTHFRRKLVI